MHSSLPLQSVKEQCSIFTMLTTNCIQCHWLWGDTPCALNRYPSSYDTPLLLTLSASVWAAKLDQFIIQFKILEACGTFSWCHETSKTFS